MLEALIGSGHLRQVLCLGAHCDDIEIGCGATLMRLLRDHPETRVHWAVLSSSPVRAAEARRSAAVWLGDDPGGRHEIEILEFRNGFFPWLGEPLKEWFEQLKARVSPELILTHHREDLHQDHRMVAELTWNTFRDALVLEYEIPKFDAGLPPPNAYVPATREDAMRKAQLLPELFASEAGKHWFDPDLFLGLMRLRGMECVAPEGLAEAFHLRKVRLGFGAGRTPAWPQAEDAPNRNFVTSEGAAMA